MNAVFILTDTRVTQRVLDGKLGERDQLKNPGVHRRKILK
jgi:hypothetical protein